VSVEANGVITHKKASFPRLSTPNEEKFSVIKFDKNLFGLRSYLGTFISACNDGSVRLSKFLSPNSLFKADVTYYAPQPKKTNKLKFGKAYYLKTAHNGYLSAAESLKESFDPPKEDNIFIVEHDNGDIIHLFSPNIGRYITPKEDGSITLEPNDENGFQVFNSKKKVSLKSKFGKYLVVRRDGAIVQENTLTSEGEFETFKKSNVFEK